jgi:hypothetical protein
MASAMGPQLARRAMGGRTAEIDMPITTIRRYHFTPFGPPPWRLGLHTGASEICLVCNHSRFRAGEQTDHRGTNNMIAPGGESGA